jgi:hypothetical protein
MILFDVKSEGTKLQIDRKDIGYTIYSRLEEALRILVRETLLCFGNDWPSHIPRGILQKIDDKSSRVSSQKLDVRVQDIANTFRHEFYLMEGSRHREPN